jgi:hypothetical protein
LSSGPARAASVSSRSTIAIAAPAAAACPTNACPSKVSPLSATKQAPRSSSRVSVVSEVGSCAGRATTSQRVARTIDWNDGEWTR